MRVGPYSPWQARVNMVCRSTSESIGNVDATRFWRRLLAAAPLDFASSEVDSDFAVALLTSIGESGDRGERAGEMRAPASTLPILAPATEEECAGELLLADWSSVIASHTKWPALGLPHVPDPPSPDELSGLLHSPKRYASGQKEKLIRVQTAYRICRELKYLYESLFEDLAERVRDMDLEVQQLLIETALHRVGIPGTCHRLSNSGVLEIAILWPETPTLVHPMIAELRGKQARLSEREAGSIPEVVTRLLVRYLATTAHIALSINTSFESLIIRALSEPKFEGGHQIVVAEMNIPTTGLQRVLHQGPDWLPAWLDLMDRYQSMYTVDAKRLVTFANQFSHVLEQADSDLMLHVGPFVTISGFDHTSNLTPLESRANPSNVLAGVTSKAGSLPNAAVTNGDISFWLDIGERAATQRATKRSSAQAERRRSSATTRPTLNVKPR